jgi:fatty acid-binding protein DegV
LNLKPILCLRDGVTHRIEHVVGREKALDRLCEIVRDQGIMSHLAVAYTTDQPEMEQLAYRLSQFFPEGEIVRSRCGATTGTYFGPGALGVVAIQAPRSTSNLLSTTTSMTLQS